MEKIKLIHLHEDARLQFIRDNQEAFNYGALEEFRRRDDLRKYIEITGVQLLGFEAD